MAKQAEKHDTFIVIEKSENQRSDIAAFKPTHTVTLPGGQKVHALDRSVFDRAVKAAIPSQNKK